MNARRLPHLTAVVLLSLGAWLAASAGGCIADHADEGCPELCAAQEACPGDHPDGKCIQDCRALEETAETNGCSETWEKLLECWSHAEDVCDAEALADECTVQAQAHEDCLAP